MNNSLIKKRNNPEHEIQVALFQYVGRLAIYHEELELFHAIPNGRKLERKKNKQGQWYSPQGLWLQDEGMKKGVLDCFLPVARHGYHGLFIEHKAGNNKLSPDQEWWVDELRDQGYFVVVSYSVDASIHALLEYLDITSPEVTYF